MHEIWRDIKGYKGCYQVSSLGRVRSLRRKRLSNGYLRERILKFGIAVNGYFYVILCKDRIIKPFSVHRLVAQAFIPNPDNKPEVNHKSGVKTDNEVNSLEWCTHKENIEHRDNILGKNNRGENHPRHKLMKADVLQIKESKLKQKELAEIFRVSHQQISKIKNDKLWKNLDAF